VLSFVTPLVGGGGFRWLLRLLIRVIIWHFVVQTVGGFLSRYTHLPPLVNVIILVVVIVIVRFVVLRIRQRGV
jgi:hypothetical protein